MSIPDRIPISLTPEEQEQKINDDIETYKVLCAWKNDPDLERKCVDAVALLRQKDTSTFKTVLFNSSISEHLSILSFIVEVISNEVLIAKKKYSRISIWNENATSFLKAESPIERQYWHNCICKEIESGYKKTCFFKSSILIQLMKTTLN